MKYQVWNEHVQRSSNVSDEPRSVKVLVRWATGKRLTSHLLPKLSLVTLSPPLNSRILGLRMGLYVPTPMFFYNLWGPRESDSSDSWHEEIHFSFKGVFMVDVRFELTTNDPWSVDDAIQQYIGEMETQFNKGDWDGFWQFRGQRRPIGIFHGGTFLTAFSRRSF